jgi:hypothetical protein
VYGIFAQACWAQYGDEAGIEELHIPCSDWWEDLAEKEQEKFQSLAVRSNAIALWPLRDRRQPQRRRRQEVTPTRSPSSRPPTSTTSNADEKSTRFLAPNADKKSRFSPPDVFEKHFSTLNADGRSEFSSPRSQSSRQLTSTRGDAGVDETMCPAEASLVGRLAGQGR